MKKFKSGLENLPEENQKFVAEFMVEYYKRFNGLPPKELGKLLISFGSAIIACGAAISNAIKKSDSLLPCPFCKSIDVEYEFNCSQGVVKCNSCGVEGPEVSEAADPICSISAAKEAWNNR